MGLRPVARDFRGGGLHLLLKLRVALLGESGGIAADGFVDLLQGIHGFGSFHSSGIKGGEVRLIGPGF